MSYEPTLVIKKADLAPYAEELDYHEYDSKLWPEHKKVLAFLKEVYFTYPVSTIDGIELLICQPQLTSFNKLVCAHLSKWNVQFDYNY